ncbi:MAG: hypothetical protein ACJARN_002261 [Arenicella sp.]|jgi:hypothetical protein
MGNGSRLGKTRGVAIKALQHKLGGKNWIREAWQYRDFQIALRRPLKEVFASL